MPSRRLNMRTAAETASFNPNKYGAVASDPTANRPCTSPHLPHTDFTKVRVHTAKCDSCDRHNKLTLYRCVECGQHVCSRCWEKSGDGTHVFGGGAASRDVSEAISSDVRERDDGGGEKGRENAGRTRARRKRARVVSDDEEEDDDDDLPVLKPASSTGNAEAIDASERPSKRLHVIMDGEQHQDHADDWLNLWPMVSATGPPTLRPPIATTESVVERNPHIHVEEEDPEHHRTVHPQDTPRRQTLYRFHPFAGEQAKKPQPPHRPQPSTTSHQQAGRYIPFLEQPALYRPRPESDVDKQAANPRNQMAFSDSAIPSRRRPTQISTAEQQAGLFTRSLDSPAVYRPRPGANLDLQAARNQLAFAPCQNNSINYQTNRSGQTLTPHQRVFARLTPRLTQPLFSVSQQHVQPAANKGQMAARDQYLFHIEQHAQTRAESKQMGPPNRQAVSLRHSMQPAATKEQLTAHNQRAFISNQSWSSAARCERMMATREHQHSYLSPEQVSHPYAAEAKSLDLQRLAPNRPPFPPQGSLSSKHSPETIAAADALLRCAGVEHNPGNRLGAEKDANRDPHSFDAADRSENLSSGRSESSLSSMTLVSPSGVAGANSISPRCPASDSSPNDADVDSGKARLDRHRRRLAGLQSPSSPRTNVCDTPANFRSHASHRHATLQPESGPTLSSPSVTQSSGSSFHPIPPDLDSRLPISDRVATYLDQWNAGRAAALSPKVDITAVDVPPPRPENPCSPVLNVSVPNTTVGSKVSGDVAETSKRLSRSPLSVHGRPSDVVDVTKGSPELVIREDDQSGCGEVRSPERKRCAVGEGKDTLKRPRGDDVDEDGLRKEHKASGDVDVVDARKRNVEKEKFEPVDDDANDCEIVSWKKLDSRKTNGDHGDAKTGAKDSRSGGVIRKGVAHVKKRGKGKTRRDNVGW